MEHLLGLLIYILIGLILTRKLPAKYSLFSWGYWANLALILIHSAIFCPFRYWRVVYDLQRLIHLQSIF